MKSVFWKELRENFKWAIVIFGVLLVFVYNEIRTGRPYLMYHLPESATVFLAPLAGLLMGIAQTVFEIRPDNWAFVVHRPLSRRSVFIAKCAAGLLLLYAALALPCLLAAAWSARPGNLPVPFQPRMMLPTLVDVLNSGSFYFAGMVLTLRKARWFGSRVLPLGLAVVSSMALYMVIAEASQAVLWIGIVMCVEALAAWNVFSTAGAAELSGLPSAALGMMIYAGAMLLGIGLGALPTPFYSKSQWHQFFLDREGNPLQVTWSRSNDNDRTSTITDPNGQPLKQYEGMDVDDPVNADRFVRFSRALVDESVAQWPASAMNLDRGYRRPTAGLVSLRTIAPPGARVRSVCTYNVERGLIELYDSVTRVAEGTVGPDGFTATASTPEQTFPGSPLNSWQLPSMHTLSFPSAIYWLELDERRVRPVFMASADDPVVSAAEIPPDKDPKIVALTKKRLLLLQPFGETIFSIPCDLDVSKHFFEPAILPANGHLVLYVGNLPWADDAPLQYLEFGSDGQIVRTTELSSQRDPAGVKAPQTAIFGGTFPVAASPLLLPWMIDAIFDIRALQYSGWFYGCMLAGAVLSAAATWWIGRRCGFSTQKIMAWSVTNFLFGPAAVVVMLSLNEWPARETCATCGGKRLVGRRECWQCGAALPPPTADGREIFEPVEDFQTAA